MEPESKLLIEAPFLANFLQDILADSLHLNDGVGRGDCQSVVDVLFGKDEQMLLSRCPLNICDDVILLIFIVERLFPVLGYATENAVISIDLIAKDPFF